MREAHSTIEQLQSQVAELISKDWAGEREKAVQEYLAQADIQNQMISESKQLTESKYYSGALGELAGMMRMVAICDTMVKLEKFNVSLED